MSSNNNSSTSSSKASPQSVKTSFTWTVENFSNYDNDGFVASPHFTHANSQMKFYLTLLPIGVTIRNAPWSKSHVFIYLWLVSDHENVKLKYEISIQKNGQKYNAQDGHACFISNKKVLYNWQYNISRSFLLDPENELLIDDKLLINCEVEVIDPNRPPPSPPVPSEPAHSLSNDFKCLLKSGKFTDVVLRVGSKQLKAHKAVLAARSPVFAAMFEHETKEKAESAVDIIDLDVSVCEQMLHYIYTDKIVKVDSHGFDLLAAADKYQLESLKSTCEKNLCESISIESVSNCLLLADMHQAQQLKEKCIDFITDKPKEVMATQGWKEATKARPELGLQLFQHIVDKIQK